MKERILWIDFLKVVAMFLVLWGHSLMHYGLPDEMHYALGCAGWIYTFHMPLFMVLSGFVSAKLLTGNGDIRRKFDQLIVPCIFCYVIYQFVGDTNNLWYLKSLFVCYVLYDWMLRLKGNWRWIVIGAFMLLCFPILPNIPIVEAWKIDWMFPFFGLGLLLHKKMEWVKGNLKWLIPSCLIAFIGFLYIFDHDYIYYFSRSRWFDYRALWNPSIHFLHVKSMWPCIYRLITGSIGSMVFITIAMWLEYGECKIGKWAMKLAPYGKYSLHLFILGNAIFMIGHYYNVTLPWENICLYSFVLCPVIAAGQSVIYVLVAKVLEKCNLINQYVFGQVNK